MRVLAALLVLALSYRGEAAMEADMYKMGENCGESMRIAIEARYRLVSTGASSVKNCKFDFTADSEDNCKGLCYMFNQNAMFKDPRVRMIISTQSGTILQTYDNSTQMKSKPVCMTNTFIEFNLQHDKDYEYNPKLTTYQFILDVYNKCGSRADIKGITYQEAIENVDGYHHGKDREDRERNTYVGGILLGFGLASIFLVVLLIGYCYVRNSPNRGPNRSVGLPKVGGFKKNMKPNKEPASSGTEMGVKYTATGDKPEAKPLLTASDPEKPPAETVVVAVEEGGK